MNKKIIIGVLVVCLLAFVAVFAFSQSSANVRWEYTMLNTRDLSDNEVISQANRLGQEGWELVLAGVNGNYRMIFKRIAR